MKGTTKRRLVLFAFVLIGCLIALGGLYHYVDSGGLVARQKPSRFEAFVARSLVDLSIPGAFKKLSNPLTWNDANADAGRELYQKNCEVCHGSDGKGVTATASGLYPQPLSLARAELEKRKRTDGALFYFVHSYQICCDDAAMVIGTCEYGEQITAVLQRDNLYGTQFHPEKSQRHGLSLLDNFLKDG